MHAKHHAKPRVRSCGFAKDGGLTVSMELRSGQSFHLLSRHIGLNAAMFPQANMIPHRDYLPSMHIRLVARLQRTLQGRDRPASPISATDHGLFSRPRTSASWIWFPFVRGFPFFKLSVCPFLISDFVLLSFNGRSLYESIITDYVSIPVPDTAGGDWKPTLRLLAELRVSGEDASGARWQRMRVYVRVRRALR